MQVAKKHATVMFTSTLKNQWNAKVKQKVQAFHFHTMKVNRDRGHQAQKRTKTLFKLYKVSLIYKRFLSHKGTIFLELLSADDQ